MWRRNTTPVKVVLSTVGITEGLVAVYAKSQDFARKMQNAEKSLNTCKINLKH